MWDEKAMLNKTKQKSHILIIWKTPEGLTHGMTTREKVIPEVQLEAFFQLGNKGVEKVLSRSRHCKERNMATDFPPCYGCIPENYRPE